ncbi:helix-hairpin-helix domain-containing protein [Oscillatoria sp. FACHB-1407]|uniref:pentapeptide repeat-containing protein n=1 Tax=Oscillatoria sp. FACHB-1407 TaxID=2692847 RepID=UPI0016854DA8|nr:pentapeptide repeat-containing protein [Oscillatoria sp. FACHB-1407]MBD2463976.1 helix-hairpin-helix domain-containing protein [Oscillatoria sp. FACHB-1407]
MVKSETITRAIRCIALIVSLWFGIAGVLSQPAWGAIAQPERIPLTVDILQERLRKPTQIEGSPTIDLRRFVIDLRSENATFREQFYRLLQTALRNPNSSLGLDLSYSLIQGELQMSELGLRASLYGQLSPSLFSETEQTQIERDRRRLSQLSQLSRSLLLQTQLTPLQLTVLRGPLTLVQTQFDGFANFTNTFFLGRVEAQGADFLQRTDWSETRFSRLANFAGSRFRQESRFRSAIFFDRARFNQVQFLGSTTFQGSEFQAIANFSQVVFQQTANLIRVQWRGNADFAQTRWQGQALFNRAKFGQACFLTEAIFEKLVSFREAQFNQPINLRGASILTQADWGDAGFAQGVYLNVAELQFNAEQAQILGNPGQVGRRLSVPTLQGNEALLRSLVRNFRLLEQISDVNWVEYTREKLRLRELRQQLVAVNLNTATVKELQQTGFSPQQAEAIAQARLQQPFQTLSDLLRLENINLATYVRVRDRVITSPPRAALAWLGDGLYWLGLGLLLSLTRFGTSSWLVFGVGLVAIAYFAVLFWLVDRFRRLTPQPIIPTIEETTWMLGGSGVLAILGLSAIFRTAEHPWVTLACLALVTVPIPAVLLGVLYWQGRYHDLMTVSYFVEDGSLRQLRLLIGRLPNIPRYPLFRERYAPILCDRRWNWLNYLDFSLNNLLKLGFNDIRLRDQHLPGLITALAWYQWGLGVLYIALLLWTFSRTIPGLNLLIYFK